MRGSALPLLILLLAGGGLFACQTVAPLRASAVHERVSLAVPFFPQEEGACGPASLAAVLHFWRDPVSPQVIARSVLLGRGGTFWFDLVRFASDRGFMVRSGAGTLEEVRAEIDRGRPVIAFVDLGIPIFPAGHFIVVTGYDGKRIIVHSGRNRDLPIAFDRFLRAWERTGRRMIVVTPPDGRI